MPGNKLASLAGTPAKATLPDGTTIDVQPFSLDDLTLIETVEPPNEAGKIPLLRYNRARLWVVLRSVPGYESTYEEWTRVCNAEAYARLKSVREAIDEANPSFRPEPARAP